MRPVQQDAELKDRGPKKKDSPVENRSLATLSMRSDQLADEVVLLDVVGRRVLALHLCVR